MLLCAHTSTVGIMDAPSPALPPSTWSSSKDGGGRKQRSPLPGDPPVWQRAIYFPTKPQLERLFLNKETAVLMRWHKEQEMSSTGKEGAGGSGHNSEDPGAI